MKIIKLEPGESDLVILSVFLITVLFFCFVFFLAEKYGECLENKSGIFQGFEWNAQKLLKRKNIVVQRQYS